MLSLFPNPKASQGELCDTPWRFRPKEAGMNVWRGRAADIFANHGEIAAKMKSALGPLGFSPREPWCARLGMLACFAWILRMRRVVFSYAVDSEAARDLIAARTPSLQFLHLAKVG